MGQLSENFLEEGQRILRESGARALTTEGHDQLREAGIISIWGCHLLVCEDCEDGAMVVGGWREMAERALAAHRAREHAPR